MERILRSRNRVLRLLTSGSGLEEIFAALCAGVEEVMPGLLCSVLVVDPKERCLRLGAAPSLPADYVRASDGFAIGPGRGSCGHAAATGEVTIVEDVMTHPYWAPFRDIARAAGIRACWSQPIRDPADEVVGTLAIYAAVPRAPEAWELEVFETSAAVAGFAIEHKRTEARRLELQEQLRQIIDLVPQMIFAKDREGRFLLANAAVARAYGTTVGELMGRRHAEVHSDPDELRVMLSDDREVIDSGLPKVIPEETFVDASGTRRIFQATNCPTSWPAGRSAPCWAWRSTSPSASGPRSGARPSSCASSASRARS
jgi:PAS domain S-box-containing protein